ncbi:MAG: restriction endonuclease subunit S, partial [Actinomycetia bacterium]|nr:restriction endonuclease subunit S [Actinomycetes bacterium]
EYRENYLPYLSTEYLRENKHTKFVKISCDVIFINTGDLILLWDGSNAGEFFIAKNGILSSTMVKLQPKKENINLIFLFYLLKIKENYLSGLTRGTGIPHVDKNVLENLTIFLPPLPEQKKIAEILSTVDQAIEEVNEAIAKTEKLKKGLMQELLAKGIGHKEFKEKEIGEIPKEWKIVEMKDAVDINKEFRDPRRELSNKKFFYIDIDSIENETGIIKNLREIIGREAPSRARRQVRYNDVIMSTVRPYLKAFAIIPKLYDGQICSTGFAVLRCKERILPEFLFYILFSKSLVSQFNRAMVGAQYPALNSSHVKKLKILLPHLPEQKKIAEILATVAERIQLLKEKKEKLGRVKKGLMNDLLTGRKRVKVEA